MAHLEVVQHLDLCWTDPHVHRNFERLAGMGRAVVFQRRGFGLSDPVAYTPTLEQQAEDVLAVMDAVGVDRAVLFGTFSTCFPLVPEQTRGDVGHLVPVVPVDPQRVRGGRGVLSFNGMWGVVERNGVHSAMPVLRLPDHESSRSSGAASMSVSRSFVGSSSNSTLGGRRVPRIAGRSAPLNDFLPGDTTSM